MDFEKVTKISADVILTAVSETPIAGQLYKDYQNEDLSQYSMYAEMMDLVNFVNQNRSLSPEEKLDLLLSQTQVMSFLEDYN